MARDYGRIKITIWQNEDFTNLTAAAQQLYFYIITQSRLDMAGIVQWRPRMAAKSAADLTVETVEAGLEELEAAAFVLYDEDTEELLVRSFIRSDEVLRSPNLAVAMVKAWRGTDSPILRKCIAFEVDRLAEEDSSLKGLDRCQEVLEGPFMDTQNDPFGKGLAKGSGKGCRTTTTTSTTLTTTSTSTSAADTANRFDEFWAAFPAERKTNKPGCKKKFTQATRTVDPNTIIQAANNYREDPNRDPAYTVGPHRWLNEARWDDPPLPPRPGTPAQTRLATSYDLVQRAKTRGTQSHGFPQQELER